MNVTFTKSFFGFLISSLFTPIKKYENNTYNVNTNYDLITDEGLSEKFAGVYIDGSTISFDGNTQGLFYDTNEYATLYLATTPNYRKNGDVSVNDFIQVDFEITEDYKINVINEKIIASMSGVVSGIENVKTIYGIGLAPSDEWVLVYYDIEKTDIKEGDKLTFTFVISIGGTCNVR